MGRKQAQAFFAALIAWPVAAQDYNPVLIPPQIIGSPQTMTPLNGGDDSTRLVQFAFPFEYFGQTFTQAWVSSNGFVSFGDIGHLCCDGWPIENAPRNTIYGLWSDLISGSNPYYRSDTTSTVFGWYGTQEYGSGLSNTFEIALFPDGKVQWNYGDVNNIYHTVTAGLTGPTMADSINLFYGQNVNLLDNTSYVTGAAPPPPPEPEPLFNPVDPVSPVPTVSIGQAEEPVAETTQEETVEEQPVIEQIVEETVQETVAETETITQVIEEPVEEEVAVAVEEETVAEEQDAERLSPDELIALAAGGEAVWTTEEAAAASDTATASETASKGPESADDKAQASQGGSASNSPVIASGGSESRLDILANIVQLDAIGSADSFERETVMSVSLQKMADLVSADWQDTQTYGAQTTTEVTGEGYVIVATDGPTFGPPIVLNTADTTSPSNQAQQMELLNMSGMQGEMSAGQNIDVGDVNSGDNEAMTQLAAVPAGYSAYTQARIPDQPFYQPRDIYKARRIPDANVALYRMMRGQDQLWDDMVEDQYE
jgi:hypothetical protein